MKKSNGIKKVIKNRKTKRLETRIAQLESQGWREDSFYACRAAMIKDILIHGLAHPKKDGIIFCPYSHCAMEVTDIQSHFLMGSQIYQFLKKKKIA